MDDLKLKRPVEKVSPILNYRNRIDKIQSKSINDENPYQLNLIVRLENMNVFEFDGQYAIYSSTISRLEKLYEDLILPVRINSRKVKECPDCSYKTIFTQCYKLHRKAKHKLFGKEDLFHCFHCPYLSYDKSKLITHMVSHMTRKTIECPDCGKMFKAKHSLRAHINWNHRAINKYYYCDTCSYKSITKSGLVSHKERTHVPDSDRKEEFACELCSYKTNKKWALQDHVNYKHTKRFNCSKCTFSTSLEPSLASHTCKTYECNYCKYKTHRISTFKVHLTRHRTPEELPLLKCPFCSFTTTSPTSFYSHKGDHKRNVEVKCPQCQLSLKKKSLRAHMNSQHSEEKEGLHDCPHCHYNTLNIYNLQRHVKAKHTDKSKLETIRCEQCEFTTKSKGSMYMHEKRHYAQEKIYNCDQCKYATLNKTSLKTHSRIHGKRTKISCDKCSKTFLAKNSLKAHIKSVHEDNKKYVCRMCPKDFQKIFRLPSDLRLHMMRHKAKSELQTFKCYDCPYEAKRKLDLVKHIKKIHLNNKDKYYICKKCYYRTKHEENLENHIKEMHAEVEEEIVK